MNRAISLHELYNTKRNLLELSPRWTAHLGTPELSNSWIIWGDSQNGKTSYSLQLAKELAKHVKVAYNSLEEGNSRSFELACKRENMIEVKNNFLLIEDEYEELMERLSKHKSPKVVINDSLQYLGIDYRRYKKLLKTFPDKLFIFVSHAEGKHPEGRTAKKVRYDAMVKTYIQGYIATANGRYGGGEPYIIWEEGAQKFHENIV